MGQARRQNMSMKRVRNPSLPQPQGRSRSKERTDQKRSGIMTDHEVKQPMPSEGATLTERENPLRREYSDDLFAKVLKRLDEQDTSLQKQYQHIQRQQQQQIEQTQHIQQLQREQTQHLERLRIEQTQHNTLRQQVQIDTGNESKYQAKDGATSQTVDAVSSTACSIEVRVESNDFSDLQQRVLQLEIDQGVSTIDNNTFKNLLKIKQTELEKRMDVFQNNLYKAEERIDQSTAVKTSADVNLTQRRDRDGLVSNISDIEMANRCLGNRLTQLDIRMNNQEKAFNSSQGKISTVQTTIHALDNRLGQVESQTEPLHRTIQELQEKVSTFQSVSESLDSRLGKLDGDMDLLNLELLENESSIQSLKEGLEMRQTKMEKRMDIFQQNLSKAETRVENNGKGIDILRRLEDLKRNSIFSTKVRTTKDLANGRRIPLDTFVEDEETVTCPYFEEDTCLFTAPEDGIYVFGAYLGQNGEGALRVLIRNVGIRGYFVGTTEVDLHPSTKKNFDEAFGSRVLALSQGQRVQVHIEHISGDCQISWCWFTGSLLFATLG